MIMYWGNLCGVLIPHVHKNDEILTSPKIRFNF